MSSSASSDRSGSDSCSSSGSDSDSPTSGESDDSDDNSKAPTLREQKKARLQNLPPFRIPGQIEKHHHHHHHHHGHPRKKRPVVSLTNAEIEAVVSTFSTFAKFTGVRLRRHDLKEQTQERLVDDDLGKCTGPLLHMKEMTGIGDLLDPNNNQTKAIKGSKEGPGTTWRSLISPNGRRTSVEIVKHDETLQGRSKKKDSLYLPHAHKILHCALCEKDFKKRQLLGRVSRMSVARLRREWRGDRAHDGKHDHGKQRHTHEHFMNFGFSGAYDLVRVCVFCLQFFDTDEQDATYDADKEDENIDWEDEVSSSSIMPSSELRFPDPVSSCTLVRGNPSSNLFSVKYRSSPTSWKSFEQEISVKTKNRTKTKQHNRTNKSNTGQQKPPEPKNQAAFAKKSSPRKLDFKVSRLFSATQPFVQTSPIAKKQQPKRKNPYLKTMAEYRKRAATMHAGKLVS